MARSDRDETREDEVLGLPVALLALGLLVMTASQTAYLTREQGRLASSHENQAQTLAQAEKVLAQLDALAQAILTPAQGGNASARHVLEQLRAGGITFAPKATE